MAITTAGLDLDSICGERRLYTQAVLDPEDEYDDPAAFGYIAGADESDDPMRPDVWRKANPSMVATTSFEADLARKAEETRQAPAKLPEFQRKHLNQWRVKSAEDFFRMDFWDRCGEPAVDLEALAGERCFGGLDLSSTTDLTAFALVFPDAEPLAIWAHAWLPQEDLLARCRRDRTPYDVWAENGWVSLTGGNIVDYAPVEAAIPAAAERFSLQEVAFDPKYSTQLVTRMQAERVEVVSAHPSPQKLAAPTLEFQRLVLSESFTHGANPVLRKHAAACSQKEKAEDAQIVKKTKNARIDAVAAAVLAIQRVLLADANAARTPRFHRGKHGGRRRPSTNFF